MFVLPLLAAERMIGGMTPGTMADITALSREYSGK